MLYEVITTAADRLEISTATTSFSKTARVTGSEGLVVGVGAGGAAGSSLGGGCQDGSAGPSRAAVVITSYSIHYTKLYELERLAH